MLAYGGGSVKRNGVYDSVTAILKEAGKEIVDFPGIMPNPTYARVQEGARPAREKKVDFILAVGGGSVIDCCKIISAQAKTEKDIWEMEFGEHVEPYPGRWTHHVLVSGTEEIDDELMGWVKEAAVFSAGKR